MNKKIGFVLLLIFVGIGLITVGLYMRNKKEVPSIPSKVNQADEVKYLYKGVYNYDNTNVYIYQEDNSKLFLAVDKLTRCRATINGKKAKGICNGSNLVDEYILEIVDDKLQITSDDSRIISGLYTKASDLKIEDYFEHAFGNAQTFKSKYNGYYKSDDKEITSYQISDNEVILIAVSDVSTEVITLNINEDNTMSTESSGGTITVTLNNNKLIFSKESETLKQFDGEYTKVKDINYMDVINNDILYYY